MSACCSFLFGLGNPPCSRLRLVLGEKENKPDTDHTNTYSHQIPIWTDHVINALGPHLEESIAVIDQTIRQVRNLSLDLRPSLLDDLGLVPALRWYVDRQAQRSGLNLQLIAEPLQTKPPPEVETACFRVVQDALTNAMNHARAQRVRIELRQQEAELHVVVHDDGIGFDVAQQHARATRGESMGLLSMEERAALLGGRLEIISTHARGTEVHACFPLKNGPLQRETT